MSSISLIAPLTNGRSFRDGDLETYQRVLLEQEGIDRVEIVLAGENGGESLDELHPVVHVSGERTNDVGLLREGLAAATGDILIILDPSRAYAPEALLQVLDSLRNGDAAVVVGVPRQQRRGLTLRSVRSRTLAILGKLALGTSDGLSGLAAMRRSAVRSIIAETPSVSGSRVLLDVLTWCSDRLLDVPVTTGGNDQRRLDPIRLDDVRQIKRVLDHRFGTLSRLVQFCLVGASGMVLDLSLYALLQSLFVKLGFGTPAAAEHGGTGSLAVAGLLSIWAALTWNFLLNRRLTFNDSRAGSIVRQYLTYALGNALGIVVSLFLRLYLPGRFAFFSQHRLAAAVVGIVAATAISFSMSRWVVFIHQPERSPEAAPPVEVESVTETV